MDKKTTLKELQKSGSLTQDFATGHLSVEEKTTLLDETQGKRFRCESQLWTIETELHSLSSLFQSLAPDAALGGNDLFGAGMILQRIIKRLRRIRGHISTSPET